MWGRFRCAFVAICLTAPLLVVSACELDTTERPRGEQENAAKGGSKGWKPSTALESEKPSKPDAASTQSVGQAPDAAAAPDARAASVPDDEVDAGDADAMKPVKPTSPAP
ncbi:MAG TPA: hypothetical protein VMF89_10490, partial [Polyangiales bacterium]|nr:hypothetical protein [Polyangiales bacterium]